MLKLLQCCQYLLLSFREVSRIHLPSLIDKVSEIIPAYLPRKLTQFMLVKIPRKQRDFFPAIPKTDKQFTTLF